MNHSVTLDRSKCKGCTMCIKHCPTEAIRVRRGRAHILENRCIDCGECIRVCPYKAKKAVCDPFERVEEFKFSVALPAPSLYGQFRNLDDVNIILNGLLELGFDMVAEVSRGAELISGATSALIESKKLPRPLISSACPTAVRLICTRFPKLIPHLVPLMAPFEAAAIKAREDAVEASGLKPEEIGIFFISPCTAKVTARRHLMSIDATVIDGVLSMTDVYRRLLDSMKDVKDPKPLSQSGIVGVGWARIGGETAALMKGNNLSVDGIENIIRVLEDLEDGGLPEMDFIELNACNQGCVGGCLTVENAYVAKAQIQKIMKKLPVQRNRQGGELIEELARTWEQIPTWKLDDNFEVAIKKAAKIEELCRALPGLDCGSCGAPSCRALAEDVVLGFGEENDCIFRMRERMQYLAGSNDADGYLPPPFRHGDKEQ